MALRNTVHADIIRRFTRKRYGNLIKISPGHCRPRERSHPHNPYNNIKKKMVQSVDSGVEDSCAKLQYMKKLYKL